MSRPILINTNAVAIGVAAAITGAAVGYFGLAALARPPGASSQIALIARQAGEAEQIGSRLTPRPSYPRAAVCDGGGEAGLSTIRREISRLAGQSGGFAAQVSGAPGASDDANGGLQPVNLTIDGDGASVSVIGFLQALSTATPSVFVDKLDLRPVDGKLTMKLTGRIFCSPVHL